MGHRSCADLKAQRSHRWTLCSSLPTLLRVLLQVGHRSLHHCKAILRVAMMSRRPRCSHPAGTRQCSSRGSLGHWRCHRRCSARSRGRLLHCIPLCLVSRDDVLRCEPFPSFWYAATPLKRLDRQRFSTIHAILHSMFLRALPNTFQFFFVSDSDSAKVLHSGS